MDTQSLQDIGLTPNEIRVYIATLELGSSTATVIAKRADLPRPTTYDVLTALSEKGLSGSVIRDGVTHFDVASPHKLLEIQKERSKKIENLLPELLLKQMSVGEKPNIHIYEGKEGLKSVMDDLIVTKEPICTFSSTKDLLERLVYYFPNYITRRVEEKIYIKVLTEKNSDSIKLTKRDAKEFRQIRFVSKEFIFPNAIFIYGNKIAMLDLHKEPNGIIIENANLCQTFKVIFNLTWQGAQIPK